MKVLVLSETDIAGGAARAAYRLHQSLLLHGIDSKMLVQRKKSDDFSVITKHNNLKMYFDRLRPIIDSIPNRIYKKRKKVLFSSSWLGFNNVSDAVNDLNPDVVHLHWIAGGMMRFEEISKINAPIVWSLHDMSPFTGGCHYDQNCGLYKERCGSCKVLASNNTNDLSRKIFNRKINAYSKIKSLSIVATSRWIGRCAKESFLFKDIDVSVIPNPINTSLFRPIDKIIAKDFFQIPKNKTVILFSAMSSMSDPRKGRHELFEAINLLDIEDAVLVIAGSSKPKDPIKLKYPTYFIQPLSDEVSLPLIYNAADVMIVPSIQENLANSIIECLSCGVPVVAFDIGGNEDMIEHKRNGYLAKSTCSKDMAVGIEWVVNNNKSRSLSDHARKKAVEEFDYRVVSKSYIDLYYKFKEES